MSIKKKHLGDRIFDAVILIALSILTISILYPLIYVLSMSFSDPIRALQEDLFFCPRD